MEEEIYGVLIDGKNPKSKNGKFVVNIAITQHCSHSLPEESVCVYTIHIRTV